MSPYNRCTSRHCPDKAPFNRGIVCHTTTIREGAAMTQPRSVKVTLRMSEDGARRLKAIAEREKVSQSVLVERLLENTEDDPAGYYIRAAAIQGWATLTLLTALANFTFKGSTPAVLTHVAEASRGLFGPLPPVPKEASRMDAVDPRMEAIFEAFGSLK